MGQGRQVLRRQSRIGGLMPATPQAALVAGNYLPVRQAWLDRRKEPILEPELPIVDPHHHLWDRRGWRYLLPELLEDTSSGHNIIATVFVQARSMYREGFAVLGRLGLSFDAWLYHPQIDELTGLARAFPNIEIFLNHVGGPLGIGVYGGKHKDVFPGWAASIKALAACENVCVKLGG